MNLNEEEEGVGFSPVFTLNVRASNSDELLFSSNTIVDDLIDFFNPNPTQVTTDGTLTFQNIAFTTPLPSDSTVIEVEVISESNTRFLDNTSIDLFVNDTIRSQFLLHDYYAYDDGTAEYAVGTNQQGDQVGVQFWVNERDTITQVDIYFPNIEPSSDGERLTLRIFRDLNDETPLYTQSITVNSKGPLNEFSSYTLNRPIIVSDTFYITYEQNISQFISIGLDRSNTEASRYIHQNITGAWERNNRIEGAMMIRPVFKQVVRDTVLSIRKTPPPLVYPNPSEGSIHVNGEYKLLELRNMAGQLMRREKALKLHDFSNLPGGVYLLTIYQQTTSSTQKIILK